MRAPLIITTSVGALLVVAGETQAQVGRVFVSGHGTDSNPCSLAAPCRTFQQAHDTVASGGEIAVLDTAGYGTVTITKSISIVNEEGVEAGIAVSTATDAIDINIAASDVVNLRGLTLTGGGVGQNGINFTNLGALNIQNCVIRGFTNAGIVFEPITTATLNVSDTIISNVGNIAFAIAPTGSGTFTAAFNRDQAIGSIGGSTDGFFASGSGTFGGTINVTIANSLTANNGDAGIFAGSITGRALTQMTVTNTVVSNNATGVVDNGVNSDIVLGKNTISGNATALSGSSLFSFGDNYIRNNQDDSNTVTLTTIPTR